MSNISGCDNIIEKTPSKTMDPSTESSVIKPDVDTLAICLHLTSGII